MKTSLAALLLAAGSAAGDECVLGTFPCNWAGWDLGSGSGCGYCMYREYSSYLVHICMPPEGSSSSSEDRRLSDSFEIPECTNSCGQSSWQSGDPDTCICPGDCPTWRYRSLEESPHERHLHETTSPEDIALVAEATGGSLKIGNFHEKEGLLSAEQCNVLKNYVDEHHEVDGPLLSQVSQELEEDFSKDIPIDTLTSLLGVDTAKALMETFYTGIGSKAPVMRAYVRRSHSDGSGIKSGHHVPYHIEDDRYIMIVALNGNEEYEGGELMYLDHEGPKEATRVPGKAIIHGPEDIHGVAPHNGTRYTLFFWAMVDPEGHCLLKGTELEKSLGGFEV